MTGSTGEQTSLPPGAALPEPAAVAGVLVVVGLLGDGVDILGAVRDHAPVVGQTVNARVVGHGVVVTVLCGLGPHQVEGDH